MSERARYDGLAGWYDQEIRRLEITSTALQRVVEWLGPGPGTCLDLGCGTGIAVPELISRSRTVAGLDISDDQLRLARTNTQAASVEFIRADASDMPFPDQAFDAVVSMFTHTDFDDYARVLLEVHRVLRPGGRFVYVGTHPCYVTPFVERRPGAPHLLHPGYRRRGWTADGPGFGHGIRPRVGVNHMTLTDFLQPILDSGLQLRHVGEPDEDDYPILISLVAER